MRALHPLWGQRLLAARNAAGYTQAELAEIVGVTQQRISHWEKGRAAPRDKYRAVLARVLSVSVYHLFPFDEANGEAA